MLQWSSFMVFDHGAFCERRHYNAQFIDDSDISLVHYLKSLQQLSILWSSSPVCFIGCTGRRTKEAKYNIEFKGNCKRLGLLDFFVCTLSVVPSIGAWNEFPHVVSENFKAHQRALECSTRIIGMIVGRMLLAKFSYGRNGRPPALLNSSNSTNSLGSVYCWCVCWNKFIGLLVPIVPVSRPIIINMIHY